jgi:hypothetical protein
MKLIRVDWKLVPATGFYRTLQEAFAAVEANYPGYDSGNGLLTSEDCVYCWETPFKARLVAVIHHRVRVSPREIPYAGGTTT